MCRILLTNRNCFKKICNPQGLNAFYKKQKLQQKSEFCIYENIRLSQEPLDQRWACLYSCWCIFHADSKYGHKTYRFWKFLKHFGKLKHYQQLAIAWRVLGYQWLRLFVGWVDQETDGGVCQDTLRSIHASCSVKLATKLPSYRQNSADMIESYYTKSCIVGFKGALSNCFKLSFPKVLRY